MTVAIPEFSHRVTVDRLPATGLALRLAAGPDARGGLTRRFGLLALERLEADLVLTRDRRGVTLAGSFEADVTQACVVSGEPVPFRVRETIGLRFEPTSAASPDAEIELSGEALDVLPIEDGAVDVGEAIAQSLALALDPYPKAGPEVLAEARRWLASEEGLAADAGRTRPFTDLGRQ